MSNSDVLKMQNPPAPPPPPKKRNRTGMTAVDFIIEFEKLALDMQLAILSSLKVVIEDKKTALQNSLDLINKSEQ